MIWAAAGTACAPVLVVGFAMMQRPLWSLVFVVLYPVIVTLGYAGGRAAARAVGVTPVVQVADRRGRGRRAVLHARLSRRWPTGGWPLVGILCVAAFLLGAAYGRST